ncbi:MAG TPA: RNA polymerase sigma factor [Acidimicrobiales bacterium]|jgi:RNA polymerase sigma-70 factor (ECF subfamily)|nr:RNA polymerase sigma factor [Acidimicrobiales bacterium]
MNQDSLDVALDEARQGEEVGVAALFRAFNPGLVRYLRHHALGVEEDLASEVWAAAATLLPDFEGDAHAFRALLFTLARRRTIDHYRRSGRALAVVELNEIHEPADRADLETAVVSNLSAQEAIEALVKGLPTTQAEVILLRVVGDLSVDEVAKILGRSPGSVRVLQHRAVQRLAKKFKEVVTP